MNGGGHVMGRGGMCLAVLWAVAMAAAALIADKGGAMTGSVGLCLPSPNEWHLPEGWGWGINLSLILGVAAVLFAVNKRSPFVAGSDSVMPGIFLVSAASNAWVSGALSSSSIMAMVNVCSLGILFGCYGRRKARQELFAIASLLGVGSMVQYAFAFMIPVYIIAAVLLKYLDFKGLLAFLTGLAAPYWIGFGLGLLHPADFTPPGLTDLFSGYATRTGLLFGLANVAFTILLGLAVGLNNAVKLYAGNTERRLRNTAINITGLVCAVLVIVDSDNMVAYLGTIYAVSAVQVGNLFVLFRIRRGGVWIAALWCVWTALFGLMLTQ